MVLAALPMISATGNLAYRHSGRASMKRSSVNCPSAGFTLFEIILVIGLIALISGIAIFQIDDVDKDERPMRDWMREGIFIARLSALEAKRDTRLRFNKEEKVLEITLLDQVIESMQLPPNHQGEIDIEFFPQLPVEGSGRYDIEYGDEALEEVKFQATGASVRMKVLITEDGQEEELIPDPFATFYIEEDT